MDVSPLLKRQESPSVPRGWLEGFNRENYACVSDTDASSEQLQRLPWRKRQAQCVHARLKLSVAVPDIHGFHNSEVPLWCNIEKRPASLLVMPKEKVPCKTKKKKTALPAVLCLKTNTITVRSRTLGTRVALLFNLYTFLCSLCLHPLKLVGFFSAADTCCSYLSINPNQKYLYLQDNRVNFVGMKVYS